VVPRWRWVLGLRWRWVVGLRWRWEVGLRWRWVVGLRCLSGDTRLQSKPTRRGCDSAD